MPMSKFIPFNESSCFACGISVYDAHNNSVEPSKLLICGRCGIARFCSVACKELAWMTPPRNHGQICEKKGRLRIKEFDAWVEARSISRGGYLWSLRDQLHFHFPTLASFNNRTRPDDDYIKGSNECIIIVYSIDDNHPQPVFWGSAWGSIGRPVRIEGPFPPNQDGPVGEAMREIQRLKLEELVNDDGMESFGGDSIRVELRLLSPKYIREHRLLSLPETGPESQGPVMAPEGIEYHKLTAVSSAQIWPHARASGPSSSANNAATAKGTKGEIPTGSKRGEDVGSKPRQQGGGSRKKAGRGSKGHRRKK